MLYITQKNSGSIKRIKPHQKRTNLQLILGLLLSLTQELTKNIAARNQIVKLLRRKTTLGQDLGQSVKLLGDVSLTLLQLVSNLDIVLSILLLHILSGLLDFVGKLSEALGRHVFGDE